MNHSPRLLDPWLAGAWLSMLPLSMRRSCRHVWIACFLRRTHLSADVTLAGRRMARGQRDQGRWQLQCANPEAASEVHLFRKPPLDLVCPVCPRTAGQQGCKAARMVTVTYEVAMYPRYSRQLPALARRLWASG